MTESKPEAASAEFRRETPTSYMTPSGEMTPEGFKPTPYTAGLMAGVIHEKQARLEALDMERAELVATIAELKSEADDLHVV